MEGTTAALELLAEMQSEFAAEQVDFGQPVDCSGEALELLAEMQSKFAAEYGNDDSDGTGGDEADAGVYADVDDGSGVSDPGEADGVAEGVDEDAEVDAEGTGLHWTVKGQWLLHGLTPQEVRSGRQGMAFGARMHYLFDKFPEILVTPPSSEWAPGWEPMNRNTIAADDTLRLQTKGGEMCRAISSRCVEMLTSDARRVRKGAALREVDQPRIPFASHPHLIRIFNAGGGICGNVRCRKTLLLSSNVSTHAQVRTGTAESSDYTRLGHVWSANRRHNFLFHNSDNLYETAWCVTCQHYDQGNELTSPRYGKIDHENVLQGSTLPERYASGQQWVLSHGLSGGPAACLPSGFSLQSAKERDMSTVYTCLFPGCPVKCLTYRAITLHAKNHNGPVELPAGAKKKPNRLKKSPNWFSTSNPWKSFAQTNR